MLCCIAIFIGVMLAVTTGQIYLLPLTIIVGIIGDIILYKKYKTLFSGSNQKNQGEREKPSLFQQK